MNPVLLAAGLILVPVSVFLDEAVLWFGRNALDAHDGHRARTARALCDPDVLCLQEVAANFPELAGSRGEDQFAALAEQFPDFSVAAVWGVDVPDGAAGRRRFGNLILSRLPVGRVLRHALPWPPEPGIRSMPPPGLKSRT